VAGAQVAYDVLVAAHAVSAVVGFGAVAVTGAYGVIGRRLPGPPDPAGSPGAPPIAPPHTDDRPPEREELARFFGGRNPGPWVLLAVPFLGAAALGVKPGGGHFGQAWVVIGMVIWVAAAALLLGVVVPSQRAIREGLGAGSGVGPPSNRLAWAAGACDLLFVVALFVMVIQPG
jgi:hypothetical protein